MDKLELIEGLIDKLDSVNRLLPSYLRTGGLSFDECIVMSSCHVVYDYPQYVERSIRYLIEDNRNLPLLRDLLTKCEQVIEKIEPNLEKLSSMELALLYDISIMHETIEILRRCVNINDPAIHKHLSELAFGKVRMTIDQQNGADISEAALKHDMEFEMFFDRLDTDVRRLSYILNFRDLRKCAGEFCIEYFLQSLKNISMTLRNLDITPYQFVAEIDDSSDNFQKPNFKEIFMLGDGTPSTDKAAAKKAKEMGHEYFSLAHINHIHKLFVCDQFHTIEPHDLYAILNLKECDSRLKIRDKEKNRVYYFIHYIGERVQENLRKEWKSAMCRHLSIPANTYNSKYMESAVSESTRDKKFREKLSELDDAFEELEQAS